MCEEYWEVTSDILTNSKNIQLMYCTNKSAIEDSSLLGCYAMLTSKKLPSFLQKTGSYLSVHMA